MLRARVTPALPITNMDTANMDTADVDTADVDNAKHASVSPKIDTLVLSSTPVYAPLKRKRRTHRLPIPSSRMRAAYKYKTAKSNINNI